MANQRIKILHEDNHLLVVAKPSGLLSQGDDTNHVSLLELVKEHIREKYNKPGNVFLGLVHRLDRPVSGVMVLARTSKAAGRLSAQFRDNTVRKTYLAVVKGCPYEQSGELVHFMGQRGDRDRKTPIEDYQFEGAKEARLEWEVVSAGTDKSVLRVRPITGRRHQIRAQLAQIGLPVLGDQKYGDVEPLANRSIALHAWRLELDHPVGGARMEFSTPPPRHDPWPQGLG